MGDILTLIEQAQKQFDEEEARKAAVKISDGSFGLDDFLDQLQQVRKLGPMKYAARHDSGHGRSTARNSSSSTRGKSTARRRSSVR